MPPSYVVLLISSLLIYFEMSSQVTHVKDNTASLLTVEASLSLIELLGHFLYFLITFSIELEILEVMQIHC